MFNVGGGEVLVILLVALLVLGPGKLPDAARQIGNMLTQVRRMSSGFQNELRAAMDTTTDSASTPPTAPAVEAGDADPEAPATEADTSTAGSDAAGGDTSPAAADDPTAD